MMHKQNQSLQQSYKDPLAAIRKEKKIEQLKPQKNLKPQKIK